MKTLNELLKQEPVFLNDWAESKKIGVLSDFEDVYIKKRYMKAVIVPITFLSKFYKWSSVGIAKRQFLK